jgi:hypothetical protein
MSVVVWGRLRSSRITRGVVLCLIALTVFVFAGRVSAGASYAYDGGLSACRNLKVFGASMRPEVPAFQGPRPFGATVASTVSAAGDGLFFIGTLPNYGYDELAFRVRGLDTCLPSVRKATKLTQKDFRYDAPQRLRVSRTSVATKPGGGAADDVTLYEGPQKGQSTGPLNPKDFPESSAINWLMERRTGP